MFENLKKKLKGKESAIYALASGIAYGTAVLSLATYVSGLASDLYFTIQNPKLNAELPGRGLDLLLLNTFLSIVAGKIMDYCSRKASNKEFIKELQTSSLPDKIYEGRK